MATVTKVIMDKDDLQPLADGIKELEGNTSNITLSQMENAISSTNSEINRQGTLISEIISALDGKGAPGGGGSGSGAVETCTLSIKGIYTCIINDIHYLKHENGETTGVFDTDISIISKTAVFHNVVKGSHVYLSVGDGGIDVPVISSGYIESISSAGCYSVMFVLGDSSDITITYTGTDYS